MSRNQSNPKSKFLWCKSCDGLKAKAIEHYEKFLDLWKDADPGITEVFEVFAMTRNLKNNRE
jgi:hypothetical protein